jgi:hypothetical protein
LYAHTFALCQDDSVPHGSCITTAFNACSTKYFGLRCRICLAEEEGGNALLRSRRQGGHRGRAERSGWETTAKAYAVKAHMVASDVSPEEHKLAALLDLSSRAEDANKVDKQRTV